MLQDLNSEPADASPTACCESSGWEQGYEKTFQGFRADDLWESTSRLSVFLSSLPQEPFQKGLLLSQLPFHQRAFSLFMKDTPFFVPNPDSSALPQNSDLPGSEERGCE